MFEETRVAVVSSSRWRSVSRRSRANTTRWVSRLASPSAIRCSTRDLLASPTSAPKPVEPTGGELAPYKLAIEPCGSSRGHLLIDWQVGSHSEGNPLSSGGIIEPVQLD